jgi:hypothetical protein
VQNIERYCLRQLILFKERFHNSFGCVVNFLASHDNKILDISLVEYLQRITCLVLDDIPRKIFLSRIWPILPFLHASNSVLDSFDKLFDTYCILTRKIDINIVDDIQFHSLLKSLVVEDIPLHLHRLHQRLPPKDLVVEVFHLETELASDDGAASIDE